MDQRKDLTISEITELGLSLMTPHYILTRISLVFAWNFLMVYSKIMQNLILFWLWTITATTDRGVFSTPAQVFSSEHCEIYKNTYFDEHLWTVASKYTLFRAFKSLRFCTSLYLINRDNINWLWKKFFDKYWIRLIFAF